MPVLRLILGDQLTRSVSALNGVQPDDIVIMVEVRSEASYVKHHKKKIAFLFSAMRHFAERLRADGLDVRYRQYDDPQGDANRILTKDWDDKPKP